MGAILKVRDDEGNIIEIPALKGDPGKGDMEASVYDPTGKKQDVFKYTDDKISAIPKVDAYTKAQTLADETKTLFGLGANAVPDDVLGVLSRFQNGLGNEYVWAKTKSETNVNLGSGTTHTSEFYLGTAIKGGIFYYSDDPLAVAQKTCDVYTSSASTTAEELQTLLAGKYFTVSNVSHEIYYADQTVTFSVYNWDYWQAANITQYANFEVYTTTTVFGYVNSPYQDAYPVDDGYTYTELGQLGAKVQIATGSYTGTGTSGASNPNSLIVGFKPEVVFVAGDTSVNVGGAMFFDGMTMTHGWGSSVFVSSIAFTDNGVSWYASSADQQLNKSGQKYRYCAIG